MAEAARREDWPRTLEEFELWHASSRSAGSSSAASRA